MLAPITEVTANEITAQLTKVINATAATSTTATAGTSTATRAARQA